MALINCPGCSQRVSDVISMCPNCGYVRGEVDDEQVLELRRRAMRDRVYHLNMTSYVVISLFLAAFGWYWWDTGGFLNASSSGPVALLSLSVVAYATIRVMLFRARRKLKTLSRSL